MTLSIDPGVGWALMKMEGGVSERTVFLEPVVNDTEPFEPRCQLLQPGGGQFRVAGGPDFEGNAAFLEQLQALPGPFAAAGCPGECGVVLGQVLDVESHPVDQGKHLLQAIRVAAARVQSDLETHQGHII